MKLKNLEMLLKYKSSQGDNSSNFQLLVNKLTETITEKELQLNDLRKVNKNLLSQLKDLREQGKWFIYSFAAYYKQIIEDQMEEFQLTDQQRKRMNMIYEMTKKQRTSIEKIDEEMHI